MDKKIAITSIGSTSVCSSVSVIMGDNGNKIKARKRKKMMAEYARRQRRLDEINAKNNAK